MINFTKNAKFYALIILSTFLIACLIIYKNKIQLGTDFTGGSVIYLKEKPSNEQLTIINDIDGIKNVNEKTINISENADEIAKKIDEIGLKIEKKSSIGAKFGKSAVYNSISALLLSLISIFLYMWLKFNAGLAFAATIALIYNCIISISFASFLKIHIDIMTICAFLTLIGYCINDTVVVFDRIRDVVKNDKKLDQNSQINTALNKVLSRSIKTSVVTFVAILPLSFFAVSEIANFSNIILCGICFGTFSSISTAPIYSKFAKITFPENKVKTEDPMKYV